MATAGKFRGKLLKMGNSEDAGTSYDFVAHADNLTFTTSFGMDEVTDNDSAAGYKDKLPNDAEWSLSGEMYYLFDTETDKDQAGDILDYHIAKTGVLVDFTTSVVGDITLTGTGYYNQLTITGSVGDYVKASFEFTGTGAYTKAVVS